MNGNCNEKGGGPVQVERKEVDDVGVLEELKKLFPGPRKRPAKGR
jgi:hypothetical protein